MGTAFVVNPSRGLLITAKHNIEDVYNYDSLNSAVIDTETYGHLHVFYASQKKNHKGECVGGFVPLRQLYVSAATDTAVLCSQVPSLKNDSEKKSLFGGLQLSPGLPEVGVKCIGFGYNKMDWQPVADEEKKFNMSLSLKSTPGEIQEVHFPNRERVLLNYPCFRTNARFDSGMSGGPVFHENGQTCGIITKSFDRADNEHISYAALCCCLFAIPVWSNPDNVSDGKRCFLN